MPWVCRACGEEFDTREQAFEHLVRKHHGQKWKGMIKQVKTTKGELPLDLFLR
jgi:hypothetical protein